MNILPNLWYVESDEMVGFEYDGTPEFRPVTTGPFETKQLAKDFAELVNGTVRPGSEIHEVVEVREMVR